ncbi:MAG: ornithine carbamoyltransferase [Verrucomicrobiales bacterium]
MKNLLSLESLQAEEITALVDLGAELKARRGEVGDRPFAGQCWALIFNKSSTRTRVSFEVGVRELGGYVMFLSGGDLQLGRGEPIRDTARVLGRMVHGAIIRTYAQEDVEDFASFSGIPTINALTDEEHPCQILADLLTMREKIGGWEGRKVVFLGDGDCNVSKSWIWASERLGFELVIAAPEAFQPSAGYLAKLEGGTVRCEADAISAVQGADVLYTDVWVSMGKEDEVAQRMNVLAPYQINATLLGEAGEGTLVMHCLPAYREKEITEEILEAHADTIFQQAENRLHAQKAVLSMLNTP